MSNTTTNNDSASNFLTNDISSNHYDMVVFCHLRWQFVYQRPQHIISRMAKSHKILLIEEPIGFETSEEGSYNLNEVNSNLHVLQPKVHSIQDIARILTKVFGNRIVPIGWFYSAAFSILLSDIKFEKIVYDCMDELSMFKGANQQLIDQERFLLSKADVVFTGGKSLYDSKSILHENVYCFPSSVDEKHFAKAATVQKSPTDIADLSGSIVGYFGVIDERIDLEMIMETAKLMPQVNFLMIGPLAKIGEEDLPRAKNIRYTGMRSYDELPDYLGRFDIAMMPFALNDATKFISPTKTLEYMAAGKPIISTRITDVMRDYSDSVVFVDDAEEFAEAITETLAAKDNSSLISDYRKILDNTSWDATAGKMMEIINKVAK